MIPRGLVKIKREDLPQAAREMIKEKLTVVPFSTSSFNQFPDPIRLWADDGEHIYVPRGFYNLAVKKRFGDVGVFAYSRGANQLKPIPCVFQPRDGQGETIEATLKALSEHPFGGAIIEAKTAAGKTYLTLAVARALGLKTLVVVHTSVLMEQWKKEIKRFYPDWSVGVVQGPTMDVKNNDICVGMLQSIALKDDYPASLYEEFGTIIFDETQFLGGQEFKNALFKFNAQYMIGASGTLQRKDKAENVFKYGLGAVVQAMNKIEVMTPVIYMVDTKYCFAGGGNSNFDRERMKFLQTVVNDNTRNGIIVSNAVKAAKAGRHVLVLSERVGHVEILYKELARQLIPEGISVGMMVGSTKQAQRDVSQEAQVLVATVQLVSVGFDKPRLDTLIFGTPVQSMEQAVGRIRRQHPDKKAPMVLDLVDNSRMAMVFAKSRLRKYREKGFKVVNAECIRI